MNKVIKILLLIALWQACIVSYAQNFSDRSNTLSLDYSDSKTTYATAIANITWVSPLNQTVFLKEGVLAIDVSIDSKVPLKTVSLLIRNKTLGTESAARDVTISDNKTLTFKVNRSLTLT